MTETDVTKIVVPFVNEELRCERSTTFQFAQVRSKLVSTRKRQETLDAIACLQREGKPVTKATVAKRASVSVVFLRSHIDLMQAIEGAQQTSKQQMMDTPSDRAKDQVGAALRRRLDEMKQTLHKKDIEIRQKQHEIDQLYGKLAANSPLTDVELRQALNDALNRLTQQYAKNEGENCPR